MHFAAYIFNANSHQDPSRTVILHFARQPLVFFENHKNQVDVHFGLAGRNARGRWGRYEGV